MKTTDLAPNKIEEAPMGALSKVGNYVGSKLSTFAPDLAARSTGKLNTGAVANKAWSGYQSFLGQTGEKPTTSNIILWLQHNKYSPDAIKAAETVLRDAARAAGQATKDAAAKQAEKDNPQLQTFSEPAMGGASANPPPDDIAESKKPMHHLDMMRSYLDILRESDDIVDEAVKFANVSPKTASQAIMAAAQAQAKAQYAQQPAPAATATPAPAATAEPAAPAATAPAATAEPAAEPAPAAPAGLTLSLIHI